MTWVDAAHSTSVDDQSNPSLIEMTSFAELSSNFFFPCLVRSQTAGMLAPEELFSLDACFHGAGLVKSVFWRTDLTGPRFFSCFQTEILSHVWVSSYQLSARETDLSQTFALKRT